MCFSAPASFIAGAVAGTAGIAAIARVKTRSELPLAAMPLFFAAQQVIEGLLWLSLPVAPNQSATSALTEAFLLFALVFWPVYAPLAALSMETDRQRRQWIAACLVAGIAAALYFLWSLDEAPRTATIVGAHIVYSADPTLPAAVRVLYPVATCLSLMLSSHRSVSLLGVVVFVGSAIAYWVYWHAFTSVWCFFAAAASALILFHFEAARRREALAAGPGDGPPMP
jgi:hypothetical protein